MVLARERMTSVIAANREWIDVFEMWALKESAANIMDFKRADA